MPVGVDPPPPEAAPCRWLLRRLGTMRYGPPFRYAHRSDGRRVAYQVVGDGDLDLVFLFGWPTHLGLIWENPSFAGFLGKLSSFSRLILFDRVGGGLSDRGGTPPLFEDEMDDARAVLDAVGSERAALFGCHTGGRLALMMAATYPDQVSAVATFGSHPATLRDDDYPWGTTPEEHEGLLALIKDGESFEGDMVLTMVAPSEAADPSVRHWFRMFALSAATLAEQYEGIRALGPVDIRGLLGSVQAPVLALHRTGDRVADVRASRYMAERIPGARFVELPGDAHFPFFGDQDRVVALAQEFLTGATPVADAVRAGLRELGLEVRVGLHTGECELLGEDIGGIAVHIAARVLGQAVAGEIVCSRTVKDLVAGSGFRFADRGTHRLKGIPDDWQLYAVELAEG
jgi:pimeloyl-ACP methyl ester carboxylesterase